jgi:hypothetical protein
MSGMINMTTLGISQSATSFLEADALQVLSSGSQNVEVQTINGITAITTSSPTTLAISGFGSGNDAVIQGLNAQDFTLQFSDITGPAGPALQVQAVATADGPSTTITLAGFSTTDIQDGKLSASFQLDPSGSSNLFIHAT